jgi:hypothetical protein
MLDPAGKKCDLHIRAASIFLMQLELLEIRRLVALSHNEGPIVAEEPIFATAHPAAPASVDVDLGYMTFPFAVVPKAELFTRTDSARTAEDYAKEFAQKIFRRIHAQFPS